MMRKARRDGLYIKGLIDGPSGSGKTLTTLMIAYGLAGPDGRVGVIDTQNRQSERYADLFSFGVVRLRGDYHPQRFIDIIEVAPEEDKLDVLIIDSASHEWAGRGGCLELSKRPNGQDDWKTVTPLHQSFIEAITQAKCHVLVTCRTKDAWEYRPNERGRIQPYRVGTDIIQRKEFEYEFDFWLRMQSDHTASVEKSICGAYLPSGDIVSPGVETGEQLRDWLENGSSDLDDFIGGYRREPFSDTMEPSTMEEALPENATTDDFVAAAVDGDISEAPDEAEDAWGNMAETAERPPNFMDQPPRGATPRAPGRGAPARSESPANGSAGNLPDNTPVQCETCGEKVYPLVKYEHEGTEFMGANLITTGRKNFERVLCVPHFIQETTKARRRARTAK